jgi:hypothetical protein
VTESLTVSTVVDATPAAVFAVLTDPINHIAIDGTGWLREVLDPQPLTAEGQVFRVAMFHTGHPAKDYEIANKVVVWEPDRAIAWAPARTGADGGLEFGGHTWRYDLEPAGAGRTRVTLTYDYSDVPAAMRERVRFPPFPVSHLDDSLANLAAMSFG